MSARSFVYLVGAGPGGAGLLTLRAVECLQRADFVLYDQLVSPRLLRFAPQAEQKCVSELAGCHPERWPLIHQTLIDEARRGRVVVRLKGGDPLIFGRGGEEAEALREAGIPFELVPGVTAALGAASYAGIPLTHRRHASAVAFVTGHEHPGKHDSMLDWAALARFPGTLVFYMGLARLGELSAALIQHGKEATTPAALVQSATRGNQRTVETTLAELASAGSAAGLTAPTLTIIGSVVSLREQTAWLEQRPLFGKRILVTRPAGQEEELVRHLEELGAEVLTQPTVVIERPSDWSPVDRAVEQLGAYQWLVFTSVNGVHWFVRRLRDTGRDLRALGHLKLAAIGPVTAAALRSYHLEADVVPASYRSEELAATLVPRVAGQRVLLARADRGRELLREQLGKVAEVDQVAVYAQKDVACLDGEVRRRLTEGSIDLVVLTSSNIARALARLLDDEGQAAIRDGKIRLVSISPVTSAAIRELSWPVASEATEFTSRGILNALSQQ